MPAIDTELVQPLTAITDTLLKRPGVVTMQSIKNLSEMYGFTTFVEFIKGNLKTSKNMMRLSISGLILLIDIDFELPEEMLIGSPMSPNVSNNKYNGMSLSNSSIHNVSISSAIVTDEINGQSYDFLNGFGNFKRTDKILFDNLKEKTLDSFNMNLRVLSSLDRLSKNKPDDIFTMFSEIVWGLEKQSEYEKGEEKGADWNDGIKGVGKVLVNQNDKVGVFLQYWIDNRYVNRWIRNNKKDVEIVDRVYQMHFKVKENLNYNKHSLSSGNIGDNHDDIVVNNEDTKNVKKEDNEDKDIEMVDTETDKVEDNGSDSSHNDKDKKGNNDGRMYNFKENLWKTNSRRDFSLVNVELCPPVWIPEICLKEMDGVVDYEVINNDNENWPENKESIHSKEIEHETDNDRLLENIYKGVNSNSGGNGRVLLKDSVSQVDKYMIDVFVGSRMIRVFKVQLEDINRLRSLVSILRTWCKINSVLLNSVGCVEVSAGVGIERGEQNGAVSLDDLFAEKGVSDEGPGRSTPTVTVRAASIDGVGVEDGLCNDDEIVERAETLRFSLG